MKSMTGFGRANLDINDRVYNIEIKSVNHKYTDITIKMPRAFLYLEEKMKKQISSSISRGKIDVFVTYENYSDQGRDIIVNKDLVKKYMEEFNILAKENNLNLDIPVTEITKLPDVLTIKNTAENEEVIENELMQCLSDAIDSFVSSRTEEGNKIKEDLLERIANFEEIVEDIAKESTGLVDEYIVKLEARIKEILKNNTEVDQARLAQEVVFYADKCSVEEELTRLKSHIKQFRDGMEDENPIGKKIDFLIQEMNREINTTGSKSGSLKITNLVIKAKTTLEDIREQIQNIE